MIAKCASAITIRKLGGKRLLLFILFLLTGPGNNLAHLGPHREVMGRERENPRNWGSAFMGVEGEGLGFQGLTLYW